MVSGKVGVRVRIIMVSVRVYVKVMVSGRVSVRARVMVKLD